MLRKVIGVVGELLITFGAIALLYVVYTLWFTNAVSNANTQALRERFELLVDMQENPQDYQRWPAPVVPVESEEPIDEPKKPDFSKIDPFGLLYIPRLQADVWAEPLVSGISYRALASGVGHYPTTELPGEVGNFAIAGHRATNGEPFARFEKLQAGDRVFVQTLDGWFEYELRSDKKIQEDEVWVLSDSPAGQGFASGERLITLTTCDPRWNSTQRWAWWGVLVSTYPLEEVPADIAEVG